MHRILEPFSVIPAPHQVRDKLQPESRIFSRSWIPPRFSPGWRAGMTVFGNIDDFCNHALESLVYLKVICFVSELLTLYIFTILDTEARSHWTRERRAQILFLVMEPTSNLCQCNRKTVQIHYPTLQVS